MLPWARGLKGSEQDEAESSGEGSEVSREAQGTREGRAAAKASDEGREAEAPDRAVDPAAAPSPTTATHA